MALLALSIVALAVGPVLRRLTPPRSLLRAAIDGFTFVAIVGLIFGHVLPDAYAHCGWIAIVLAAVGLFGPVIFESSVKRLARQAHVTAGFVAVAGLLVHSAVDGMALVSAKGDAPALAIAVIVHRIPVGLALWWTMRRAAATRALVLMSAATVLGYVYVGPLRESLSEVAAGVFQALVGGSLLHIVLHRVQEPNGSGSDRKLGEGLGALAGIVLVAWTLSQPDLIHAVQDSTGTAAALDGARTFGESFMALARASAPALLLAYLLAGLVQVFLPKASVAWIGRGNRLSQAARGVGFGLPLPICSCGVLPVYRSLVVQGVPLPASLAFLVATPELGLDAILLSLPLLGGSMTLVRVGAAALLAISVGVIVGRLRSNPTSPPAAADPPDTSAKGARWREALRLGTTDIFDSTAPWILLGLAVAALLDPLVDPSWLSGVPAALQVPVFALLGIPVYVCASATTPMVAILLAKGVSPGAGLAFLLTGPATNVTTFGLLSRLHGRRLAIAFALTMFLATIGLGLGTDLLPLDFAAVQVEHEHGASLIEQIALAVMGLLLVSSLLRIGPRGFTGQILSWAGDAGAGHCDDDGHDHGAGGEDPPPGSPCCH